MTNQFTGKVALVTGGSSGIGRATALAFAQAGAQVVVANVQVEGGEETVRLIQAAGGDAIFVKTDVSQAADVEALVNRTVATYGRLDCAFNNAGIKGIIGTTVDCTEENWDRTLAINLKGVWLGMKYELLHMLKQGSGAIVNTSSVGGLVGFAGLPAYIASKHGVVGLTKAAALEFAKTGIRINAVCPGYTQTPLLGPVDATPEGLAAMAAFEPVGRLGQPEDIAAAVLWLCSDAASFITGVAMPVDGGYVAQ